MTKEALKLALEALESASNAIESWGSYASEYFQDKHDLQVDINNTQEAITAIKEALAQPAQQEPVQFKCTVIDDAHLNGIPLEQWAKPQRSMTKYEEQIQGMAKKNRGSVGFQEALAQPEQQEQEPVETYIHEYRSQPHPNDFGISKGHWWKAKQYADALYATPPQRKPLTDDELSDIWFKQSTDWMEFARAIEAAHGIKENT